MIRKIIYTTALVTTCIVLNYSCNKKVTPPPVDPCANKTISVAATTTDATAATSNGSITVTASGSSGFTYNINAGAFQTAATFSNLAAGTYAIIAKDGDGCTKQGSFTVNVADVCAGKTFVFSSTTGAADKCNADGSITVTVTGGTNLQYKLDAAGTYQTGTTFNNVTAGAHTVFAKDAAGCEKNTAITVAEKPAGTTFTAVRTLIQSKCVSCHGNSGGTNFGTDCNIVAKATRIKVRAVDQGTMPLGGSLTQTEKDMITAWINAGGKYSN